MLNEDIKVGSLITYEEDAYSDASNTYIVKYISEDTLFLTSPLVTNVLIAKSVNEVNKAAPKLKNDLERCLDFCNFYRNYLGYNIEAQLDCLAYYFLVKRNLSPSQKETLSFIYGKIASIIVKNDLRSAVELIKQHNSLLDDFYKIWADKMKDGIQDVSKIDTKFKKSSIYKILGFILAQIHNKKNPR